MAVRRTRTSRRRAQPGPGGADCAVTLAVAGRRWRYVGDLAAAGPEDRVFTLETDASGMARIRLGDGVRGRRPPREAMVRARYRVGGRAAGAEIVGWEGRWPPRRLALGVLLATCRVTGC
jgi:hypothetical protein